MSALRGCLAQIGCLTLVAGAGAAFWIFRGPAATLVQRWSERDRPPPAATRPAPATAADSVDASLARLAPAEERAFTTEEVQAWLDARWGPRWPPYVHDVRITLLDSRLALEARVETRKVPGADAHGPLHDLLGDTAHVRIEGWLDGVGDGQGALFVERVLVNGLPLPAPVRDRLVAWATGSAPPDASQATPALAFPLPAPAWDLAVRDGRLVVRAAPR